MASSDYECRRAATQIIVNNFTTLMTFAQPIDGR